MTQDNFKYNVITGLQYETVVPTEIEVIWEQPTGEMYIAGFDPYDNDEHFTME